MATIAQVHGMLLEEALLYLLRFSGYRPVLTQRNDPTLRHGNSGLEVMGRGEYHQIDAIADFSIPQPFVNPSRLLVEAKFKDTPVGIEIVRNAVGVLKDISEYWVTERVVPGRHQNRGGTFPRFHYQYAILSSSGFTANAQRYAIAHDIYLIPFENSPFFQPVIRAIRHFGLDDQTPDRRRAVDLGMTLSELRRSVRESLHGDRNLALGTLNEQMLGSLHEVLESIRQLQYSVLAVALRRVPLVLTPAPGVDFYDIPQRTPVRIYWDEQAWYLRRLLNDGREVDLFSFDVPTALLANYLRQDGLTPRTALDLKTEALAEIQALVLIDGETRLFHFELDMEWLEQVRQRLPFE